MASTTASDNSSLRTVHVYESQPDAKELNEQGWKFQIAKSVASSNPPSNPTFNVVWQSKYIAPNFSISWTQQYGLNWTQTLPTPGALVVAGGEWQPCNLGQVFDLNAQGYWEESTIAGDPNFMKVGKVNYQYPDTTGLHFIVGIKNEKDKFDAIFIDPTPVALGGSAFYQPQEKVQWWYQTGMRTATMINGASTSIDAKDMSKPNPQTSQFYYSTSYIFKPTAHWNTSPLPPP